MKVYFLKHDNRYIYEEGFYNLKGDFVIPSEVNIPESYYFLSYKEAKNAKRKFYYNSFSGEIKIFSIKGNRAAKFLFKTLTEEIESLKARLDRHNL